MIELVPRGGQAPADKWRWPVNFATNVSVRAHRGRTLDPDAVNDPSARLPLAANRPVRVSLALVPPSLVTADRANAPSARTRTGFPLLRVVSDPVTSGRLDPPRSHGRVEQGPSISEP
jgi:hypothetical protein